MLCAEPLCLMFRSLLLSSLQFSFDSSHGSCSLQPSLFISRAMHAIFLFEPFVHFMCIGLARGNSEHERLSLVLLHTTNVCRNALSPRLILTFRCFCAAMHTTTPKKNGSSFWSQFYFVSSAAEIGVYNNFFVLTNDTMPKIISCSTMLFCFSSHYSWLIDLLFAWMMSGPCMAVMVIFWWAIGVRAAATAVLFFLSVAAHGPTEHRRIVDALVHQCWQEAVWPNPLDVRGAGFVSAYNENNWRAWTMSCHLCPHGVLAMHHTMWHAILVPHDAFVLVVMGPLMEESISLATQSSTLSGDCYSTSAMEECLRRGQ